MKMKKNVNQLTANPKNPRKINETALDNLTKSLKEFGDLGCIVYNVKTSRLVSGHQRTKIFKPEKSEIEITKTYDPPNSVGTVAEGFITYKGNSYAYREVSWEEQKELAAMLAANEHGGLWDMAKLPDLLIELDTGELDMSLTGFDEAKLEKMMTDSKKEKIEKQEGCKLIAFQCPEDRYQEVMGMMQDIKRHLTVADDFEVFYWALRNSKEHIKIQESCPF